LGQIADAARDRSLRLRRVRRGTFFGRQCVFTRIQLSLALGQLVLLFRLMLGLPSLVHLTLNLGVTLRFSCLLLTRTKQHEKTDRWQDNKNFLHVSFRLRSRFVIRKAVMVLPARVNWPD